MAKRKIRKPSGKLGKLKFQSGDKNSISFEKIEFPVQKDEIEAFIVERFLFHLSAEGYLPFEITRYEQNHINDLDFTLHTTYGKKYLELMEIAPLEHIKGGYDKAPNSYNDYNFTESVYDKLMSKSASYQNTSESNIWLLIYPTDYRFVLSDTATALLQYWTITRSHYFEYIFYFTLFDETAGLLHWIYPSSQDYFVGFDASKYRNSWTILFKPEDWKMGRE